MCHSIPGYKHADETARAVAARVAVPIAVVAVAVWVAQMVTVAMVVGAVSVAVTAVLIATARRVVLNNRAIAVHAPAMAVAERHRLAVARAQRTPTPQIIRVEAEQVSALAPPLPYTNVPEWAQGRVHREREHVRRQSR